MYNFLSEVTNTKLSLIILAPAIDLVKFSLGKNMAASTLNVANLVETTDLWNFDLRYIWLIPDLISLLKINNRWLAVKVFYSVLTKRIIT